jgi:hypothetical protein
MIERKKLIAIFILFSLLPKSQEKLWCFLGSGEKKGSRTTGSHRSFLQPFSYPS